MIAQTAQGICNAVNGQYLRGPLDRVVQEVCTDSRALMPHSVFFALSGENFDAHTFVPKASETASAVVVSRDVPGTDPSCAVILVNDTLRALQDLAAWQRENLIDLTVVGLTGSNGKTSTKDFVASVLGQAQQTIATRGNLNNHIGVPLSILRAVPSDRRAVWEMGMNHAGELSPLCRMTRPDIGIITSIGTSHIEYLGSRDAIADEKCTLARSLPETGYMIYPADSDYADYIRRSTKARCLDCGIDCGAVQARDLIATPTGTRYTLILPDGDTAGVELPVHGRHMVCNSLLAAACGHVLGLRAEQIACGLSQTRLTSGRLNCFVTEGVTVVDDTYNANPDSMKAALATIAKLPCSGRRIAVLGKMGELGSYSELGHRLVGQAAQELGIDELIVCGTEARAIADAVDPDRAPHVSYFPDSDQAVAHLRAQVRPGDLVLFKGSRSAHMERIMNHVFPTQHELSH